MGGKVLLRHLNCMTLTTFTSDSYQVLITWCAAGPNLGGSQPAGHHMRAQSGTESLKTASSRAV
eukprot:1104226-Amphidinium_carterae.1